MRNIVVFLPVLAILVDMDVSRFEIAIRHRNCGHYIAVVVPRNRIAVAISTISSTFSRNLKPSCDCITYITVKRQKEIDKVLYFRQGISENFFHMKSQIFLLDSLPTINKVFSLIIQQEKQLFGDNQSKLIAAVTAKAKVSNSDSAQGKQVMGLKKAIFGEWKVVFRLSKEGTHSWHLL